jgi:hypothetical protein
VTLVAQIFTVQLIVVTSGKVRLSDSFPSGDQPTVDRDIVIVIVAGMIGLTGAVMGGTVPTIFGY